MTELYLYFFQFALNKFDKANLLFQKDEPCIHLLYETLYDVYEEILLSFLQPAYILEGTMLSDLSLQADDLDHLPGI